ncbi:metalloregulator ArsR/SmtB family transcription factor [Thalassotalea litorea]|uniref:Metalloregulator ArsR/SmtB family transcription factor n=1 Tax=Thalassotalea litorea TaxID=2020715 RepID=A0A5R9IVU3_9GAMM|nr:metalloregulator ArsR/SmtB family transcription factor [Thalassotalea litorea]TLU67286.1 metalloregulator ArsR/SmtB family transcription factor [Thalassotalea litorea]
MPDSFPLLFFKSLADDTRLKILLLLTKEQELCVCDLTTALALSQPKISRHLALLKQQELITSRRQGQWVFYSLNQSLPQWCTTTLQECLAKHQGYAANALAMLTRSTSGCL